MNPKISVVIPAYNEEAFLPHLLKSLQNQTLTLPYEIIVVDNNSTDKTAEIAKQYGARVVPEEKKGYAFACNAGFAAAEGEIIARADADYVQPKDWLEKIWHAFEKDKDLIALGGPTYPLESSLLKNFIYYPLIVAWMYTLKLLGRGFLFPNMAVRKTVYTACGGFNTNLTFGEDVDICLRLKKMGKIAFILSIYNYSSIRRLSALGSYDYVMKYTFGNQIAVWLGKKVTVGLEPVRFVPTAKPNPYKPWLFLYTTPLVLLLLVVILVSLFIPATTSTRMVQRVQGLFSLNHQEKMP